jgi:hypothetical protein
MAVFKSWKIAMAEIKKTLFKKKQDGEGGNQTRAVPLKRRAVWRRVCVRSLGAAA